MLAQCIAVKVSYFLLLGLGHKLIISSVSTHVQEDGEAPQAVIQPGPVSESPPLDPALTSATARDSPRPTQHFWNTHRHNSRTPLHSQSRSDTLFGGVFLRGYNSLNQIPHNVSERIISAYQLQGSYTAVYTPALTHLLTEEDTNSAVVYTRPRLYRDQPPRAAYLYWL